VSTLADRLRPLHKDLDLPGSLEVELEAVSKLVDRVPPLHRVIEPDGLKLLDAELRLEVASVPEKQIVSDHVAQGREHLKEAAPEDTPVFGAEAMPKAEHDGGAQNADASSGSGDGNEPAGGDEAMDAMEWRDSVRLLEKKRQDGQRWTSYEKMAQLLANETGRTCSQSTVHKAVVRTPALKEWATRPASSTLRMPSINGPDNPTLDGTPDERQPDPSDITEPGDIDAALDYLVKQAEESGPKAVARLSEMDPAQKRALAELAYQDPDKAEQIYRYREKRKAEQD